MRTAHKHDYGFATPHRQLNMPRLRPKSEQRSYSNLSLTFLKPSVPTEETPHPYNNTNTNDYYAHDTINKRNNNYEWSSSKARGSGLARVQADKMEHLRKVLTQQLQAWMISLGKQIHKQTIRIVQLERTITQQQQTIEQKDRIISGLVSKIPKVSGDMRDFFCKKIGDLEEKIKIMVGQLEEEQQNINQKIDVLSTGVIGKCFKRMNRLKGHVSQFIHRKNVLFDSIGNKLTQIQQSTQNKIAQFTKYYENIKNKQIEKASDENIWIKETLSTLSSKEDKASVSFIVNKTPKSIINRQDSFISDYFFYPKQQSPTLKALQELVKERDQLPIRVYVDNSGKLKYWQSRTYLFDRKGNFSSPTPSEMILMEQRGWIKIVSQS